MPSRALTVVQYGKETTRGTPVAATKKLMAEITAVPLDRKPVFPKDALGVRAAATRARIDTLLVDDSLKVPEAYFQTLPVFFNCGLKGGVTGSEQTVSQGDYLWTYLPNMTSPNAPETVTLEWADDVQEYETEFCMFRSCKISGQIPQDAAEAPVAIEAPFFGRRVQTSTVTAGIAIPSMTSINAKLARFYKDATWAGRGTTEIANALRDFEVEFLFGNHPKFFGSANQYFDDYGEDVIAVMMTLTFEGLAAFNTTAFADFQAATARAWSLKLNGPQIGTGQVNNFTANVWGAIESIEPLGQLSNGNNLTKMLIHGLYDPTGANICEVKVTANTNTI